MSDSSTAAEAGSRNVPAPLAPSIAEELRAALGAQYDVVLEKNHIHVEFQPKTQIA